MSSLRLASYRAKGYIKDTLVTLRISLLGVPIGLSALALRYYRDFFYYRSIQFIIIILYIYIIYIYNFTQNYSLIIIVISRSIQAQHQLSSLHSPISPSFSTYTDLITLTIREIYGQIIESYLESTNPYRIIPLIIESYPYIKSHSNMGYNSVICYCLGYDLVSYQSSLKLQRR